MADEQEVKQPAAAPAAKAKKKAAPERTGPMNVLTDRNGTVFDPEKHAVHADGVTPHTDSAGHFILKEHHYDGAKKAHYPDSFRHA